MSLMSVYMFYLMCETLINYCLLTYLVTYLHSGGITTDRATMPGWLKLSVVQIRTLMFDVITCDHYDKMSMQDRAIFTDAKMTLIRRKNVLIHVCFLSNLKTSIMGSR